MPKIKVQIRPVKSPQGSRSEERKFSRVNVTIQEPHQEGFNFTFEFWYLSFL